MPWPPDWRSGGWWQLPGALLRSRGWGVEEVAIPCQKKGEAQEDK